MAIVWTDRERRQWRPYTVGDALRGIDPATGERGIDPRTGAPAPLTGYRPAEGYPPPPEWVDAANVVTRREWEAIRARAERNEAARMAFRRHSQMPEAAGTPRLGLDQTAASGPAWQGASGCARGVPEPAGDSGPEDVK